MQREAVNYLIDRLETIERQIAPLEKEYRRIVEILTRKEEQMGYNNDPVRECSKCHKTLPTTEFTKKVNGKFNKMCNSCLSKEQERRGLTRSIRKEKEDEEKQREEQKEKEFYEKYFKPREYKHLDIEEEAGRIHATGMSYAEYQKQETLRLAREGKI